MNDTNRSLDVVIPLYNEASMIAALVQRLDEVFTPPFMAQAGLTRVQYIFVDDGSDDDTAIQLKTKILAGWPAKLYRLSRNFGHQAAVTAGLDHAAADFIAVMDADLQDPPELLLDMVRCLDKGFDVVYGQRRSRQESWVKKFLYWTFYRVYRFMAEIPVAVDSGDFCVMRRDVLLALRRLPEKLRFHRGLRSWVGFRQTALTYDRPSRRLGKSNYTLAMLYTLATNGIASLSTRPLRMTQGILFFSLIVTLGSFATTAVVFFRSSGKDPNLVWALSTQALVAFTSSLQIFCLYIIGAYLGRMYLEVKARPAYIVMETISPPVPDARE